MHITIPHLVRGSAARITGLSRDPQLMLNERSVASPARNFSEKSRDTPPQEVQGSRKECSMGDPMRQITCALLLGVFLMLSAEGSHAEWKRVRRPGSDIRSLAFNGSTLFAVGSKNRMYRTTDSGQTWTQVNLTGTRAVPNRAYTVLALYPECALLGTSTGSIYRGKSDGSGWSTAATGGTDTILAFAGSRGKSSVKFVAGGFGNGIRVSNDSGNTWTSSNAGLSNLKVTALGLGPSLTDSSGQIVFAATYGGGVFVSPDNCQTWSPTGQSPSVSIINALHVDGDHLVVGGLGGKVCRSSDGGNSWQDVSANLPNTEVLCLAIMTDTTDEWVYCGTIDAGVWRCRRSGGQWTPCNTGLTSPGINTILPDDGTLYIGTDEGIYRSSDAGTSWIAIGEGTMPRLTAIHAMSTTETDRRESLVAGTAATYAGTPMYPASSSIFSTADTGTTWTSTETLFEGGVISITHWDQLLFLLSAGSVEFTGGLNLSGDMGATWELRFPRINAHAPFTCMEIAAKQNKHGLDCYLGASWGLLTGVQFSSDTGRTWSKISAEPTYAIGSIDTFLIVSGPNGVLRTSDHGTTWENIAWNLASHNVTSFAQDAERLLACTSYHPADSGSGGILMTSDRGNTWAHIGLAGKTVTSSASIDNYLLAAADGRVYAATRDKFDWTDVTDNLQGMPAGSVTGTSQTCYVLDSEGGNIWERTMTEIVEILKPTASAPVLVYPPNHSTLFSPLVIFVWNKAVPAVSRYWIEVAPDSGFQAGTIDSLSADTSFFWRGETEGHYYWRVRAYNWAGWGPFSEVRTFVLSVCDVEPDDGAPSTYALYQNFPNPFNPATAIRYQVPRVSRVRLVVYDILGREVATLVNENKPTGVHEVQFDASGLPSGVYLCRMTAGSFMELRKLLLLR